MPLSEADGYHIHPDKIAEELARGTSVILTSNPRNPTGQVVANPELAEIQDICRNRATLIMDEFYSGYNFTSNCDGATISAASNVEDVDEDGIFPNRTNRYIPHSNCHTTNTNLRTTDVLIIDGLTKRFRLPGWRIAWVIGPKEFIKAIGSCGSYLDGGANVPFQEAAIPMLEPDKVLKEMKALQHHFRDKRDFVISRLREIGFEIKSVPNSTFYLWLDCTFAPPPLRPEYLSRTPLRPPLVSFITSNDLANPLIHSLSVRPPQTHRRRPLLLPSLPRGKSHRRPGHLFRLEPGQASRSLRFAVPSFREVVVWAADGCAEEGVGWY